MERALLSGGHRETSRERHMFACTVRGTLRMSLYGATSVLISRQNILPYFPILLEVYHEIQETVFNRVPDEATAQHDGD